MVECFPTPALRRFLHHRSTAALAASSCRLRSPPRLRTKFSYSRLPRCGISSNNCHAKRYAVLGAGFAGLSVSWHLLQSGSKGFPVCLDIYDEIGIGGGASGASGGLLHPYSPKAKAMWRAQECWEECLKLLNSAERAAAGARVSDSMLGDRQCDLDGPIVCRRGILRAVTTEKNLGIMENVQKSLSCCPLEHRDRYSSQEIVSGINLPFDSAVYMPSALTVHPKRYLQALFRACQMLTATMSSLSHEQSEINLYKETISSLDYVSDGYDAVVICLGAKVGSIPELFGKLPLRTCRGVVAHLQLPSESKEKYYQDGWPSILSDAWLAFQGPRDVMVGSTWDWSSADSSAGVTEGEASAAAARLLPRASAIYPAIGANWSFVGARAGLRAMPPSTPLGSLPLLGCVDGAVGWSGKSRFWLVGGLGARGLLHHGLLGKLTAQAVDLGDEGVLPPEFTSWKTLL